MRFNCYLVVLNLSDNLATRGMNLTTQHAHHRFPEKMAFLLNNPIRRRLLPPEKLISKLGIESKDVVVDFGCGPGFFTIPLAKVAGKVIGVDVSPKMLERADRYAKRAQVSVELLQSDGSELKLGDKSVDLILLNHVFHEIENKRGTLSEFLRVLKPSGRIMIVEKTRGDGIFSGRFGPPIINEEEVTQELRNACFNFVQEIHYGKDSIFVGQNVDSAP